MPAEFTNGKISVNASNCFGASPNRTITVYGIPLNRTITGPTSVMCQSIHVHYSIVSVAGASSYNWVVPTGASIIAGQGTTAIGVNYGTNGGQVKVRAISTCGSSAFKR